MEHIPKEIRKLIEKKYNKYLLNTIIRLNNVQIFLYWIYWFQSKELLEYTNLLFPNEYEKNNKRILKYSHSESKKS